MMKNKNRLIFLFLLCQGLFFTCDAFADSPVKVISIKPTMVNSDLVKNHKTLYRVEITGHQKRCAESEEESNLQDMAMGNNHRVTLVLSGGVSKGLAIIGALKFLEETGIKIDGIVGTSMGALIGAFYATGYSPDEIEEIVEKNIDWSNVFTDLPSGESLDENLLDLWGINERNNFVPRINQQGIKTGQNVYSLLTRYFLPAMAASGNCFDELYIPLIVTGTNVSKLEEKSFKNGNLVNSLRASMSFPVIFTPTYIGGTKYRDGGIANNFPLDIAQKEYKPDMIIGLDVSDKTTALLNEQPLFPFLSAYQITMDAIESLSTPIILKTKKQIEKKENCFSEPEDNKTGPNPCHLIIQLELQGGFSDFQNEEIHNFINIGYLQTKNQICQFILENMELPVSCDIDSKQFNYLWEKALRNKYPEREESDLNENNKEDLLLFKKRIETGNFTQREWSDHPSSGRNILKGIQIQYQRGSKEIHLLVDKNLSESTVTSLVQSAKLLIEQLISNDGRIEEYSGTPFSSAKIIFENGTLLGELYSWEYTLDKFEFRSNFTEKGNLKNSSVFLLGYKSSDLQKPLEEIKQNYLCYDQQESCPVANPPSGSEPGKNAKIWINEEDRENPVRLNLHYGIPFWNTDEWKNLFYNKIRPNSGENSIMSLTGKLDKTITQYYANGNTEYVRVEEIGRNYLIVSEKKNTPPWWGWWYFNYQFDNENGHNYVLKGYQSREKLSLAFDGALLNYFKEGADYGKYLDLSVLWFNFEDYFNNIKINYRLAKRIQNIFYQLNETTTENLQMMYDEWGIKLSLPIGRFDWGMPKEDQEESPELKQSHIRMQSGSHSNILGIKAEYYEIKNLRFNNNPLGQTFMNTKNISPNSEQFLKLMLNYGYYHYLFGKRIFFQTDLGGGIPQFSHEFLWSFQQSLNSRSKIGGKYTVDFNYTIGRNAEKRNDFPINEFYTLGGYFPLLENRFWREKRVDFIGSGMNEKWGENLSFAEIKLGVPISSFNELQIINPGMELQANTIIDYGGTSDSPGILSDNAEFGWGESFSLYFPVLATIEGNLNFNIGTKGKGCFESAQTCNIKIYFSTEISF